MATLYRRNKVYWLRDGKHRESLKTKILSLARLLRDDYEKVKLRPQDHLRLKAGIERYLESTKSRIKPTTYSDKMRILNKFSASVGDPRISGITTEHVENYLTTRDSLSPYRWNTERQTVSTFMNWAKARNLYRDANPTDIIPKKPEPRGKAAEALTDAQIKKIRMVIKSHRDVDEAFQIALNGGFRIQEVENQRWDDIDWERGKIKVQAHDDGWTPKDYEARPVPMPPRTMKIYRQRHAKFKALSPFVFPNSKGQKHGKDWVVFLGRRMRRAGIKNGGWHRTRHTYATRAIENGVEAEEVRKIMGISDLRTLQKYIHVSPDYEDRVRKKLPRIG